MTAEPIVEQSIEDAPTTAHQSMMDRIHSILNGAWHALFQELPDHELKDVVLNGVKATYDNAAKIVKDDLAKNLAAGEQTLQDATAAVVTGAETVVEDAATSLEAPAATDPSATDSSDPSPSSDGGSAPTSSDASATSAEVPAQAAPADGTSVPSA